MLDIPAEMPVLWVGLAVVAASLVGVAGSLPHRPAPDAVGLANTVDTVAAENDPAVATHPVARSELRLSPHAVTVRYRDGDDDAVHRAEFAFGPVTPVTPDSPLWSVLRGTPPESMFDSPVQFQQAVVAARSDHPTWTNGGSMTVRGVNWDGYHVTLVGV